MRPVSAANKRTGWAIASYLVAHAARLDVDHVIFDKRIWTAGSRSEQGWRDYDPGSGPGDRAVLEHRDHVHVGVLQRQVDVAADSAPWEQPRLLKHHARADTRRRRRTRDLHLAFAGRLESGDQPQQRALAATGCADEHQERARFNVEVDGPERSDLVAAAAVPMRDIADAGSPPAPVVAGRRLVDVTG